MSESLPEIDLELEKSLDEIKIETLQPLKLPDFPSAEKDI